MHVLRVTLKLSGQLAHYNRSGNKTNLWLLATVRVTRSVCCRAIVPVFITNQVDLVRAGGFNSPAKICEMPCISVVESKSLVLN